MSAENTLPATSRCYTSTGIDITAISRLKHADLWKAAKAMGSQAALARHLGIDQCELGQWVNLKRVPPAEPVGTKWTEEFMAMIEGKLALLTGKSWDELFPSALRENAEFLSCEKTIERTATLECVALENYAIASRDRYLNGAADGEFAAKRREAVDRVLKTLSYREAEILKMRFGLSDGTTYNREEVANVFKVTRTRIMQIEQMAIRKLQQPSRTQELIKYA